MPYKVEDYKKIEEEYYRYCNELTINNSIDDNHKRIRDFFELNYNDLKQKYEKSYMLDIELGIKFYEFINNEKDFDDIYGSNYNFWRYIAVFDIPNIVADRFGIDSKDHFYKKTTRVYPYVLYWYINLSWQGNAQDTLNVLRYNSTDEILQLVERPSKIGINLSFYRLLMKEYSNPKYDTLKKSITAKANSLNKTNTLFRMIMTKHINKLVVFRPEFYEGGIEGYIKMLFNIGGDLI